jgi:hypothetical protein
VDHELPMLFISQQDGFILSYFDQLNFFNRPAALPPTSTSAPACQVAGNPPI